MNDEVLGGSFSIDITKLKAGLAQANKLIRESESEFKAAAAGMDDWTESQEGLEARIKHLNSAQDLQKKKVAALQSEYDRLVADGLDPTSAAAVQLRTDINKEKEALAKTEKELAAQKDALAELTEESDDTASASDKLRKEIEKQEDDLEKLRKRYQDVALEQGKSSKEAKNLKKEIDKLNDELKDNQKKLDDTEVQLEKTGDAAEDAGDGFTVAKGAVAGFIADGLSAMVDAAKEAISSLYGLAAETREYRTIMASLENSSKRAGYSAEETAATYDRLYGVLGDAQTVSTTTANLQAMGLEQKNLQGLTNGVIGAWAKYGDSIPIDGLAEAVNHTAQLGEVQGTLADVIEWGGGSVDEFNEKLAACADETERADMIMKFFSHEGLTTAGHMWQQNNASIVEANKAQSENEKVMARWGEKIEPITTKVSDGFTRILEKVLELVDGVDMDAFGEMIDGAFDTFINETIPAIVDGFNWIVDNKDGIIAGIVGIGAAFAAFKVVSLIQGVVSALQGMTVAQAALNAVMAMNPIGLLVAGVAGLVAAFVVLWNKCDAFREFWINLWEGIKKAFGAVVDWVKDNWQSMLLALVNPLAGVFKYCYDNFEGFRETVDNVVSAVGKFFKDLWSGIVNWADEAWTDIKNGVAAVGKFFVDLWSGFKQGAANAWSATKETFSKVGSFFKDTFTKAWTAVKNVFSAGGKIFDGIKDGIANAFKSVVNAIIRGINKVVATPFNAINAMLDKIRNVSIAGISPFKNLIYRFAVPEIPQLATGGVVRKATTAVIGEDGAEAVVPLEKNTGWIKKLAGEIAAQQPKSVVVNQTNNYAQAHSRLELYKTKQNTAAAVRLALSGTGA